jgi:hypothetical protein
MACETNMSHSMVENAGNGRREVHIHSFDALLLPGMDVLQGTGISKVATLSTSS